MVVVSGAPATGKSTVAAALGAALGWPIVSLDVVKETLADVLGTGDETWSNDLGDAAAEVAFRLCPTFPDAVAEGWWRGARRERARRVFAGALEVHCSCDPDLAVRRMAERLARGRHPIHRDTTNASVVAAAADTVRATRPLGLGAGLVSTDTGRADAVTDAVARTGEALRGGLGC